MSGGESFACFQFQGAGSKLALPAIDVLQVHKEVAGAPHICSILQLQRCESEVRLLEIQGPGQSKLLLVVDAPVSVVEFPIAKVVRGSAGQAGPYTLAIIEDAGDLVLLLDSEKIRQATARLSSKSSPEETVFTQ